MTLGVVHFVIYLLTDWIPQQIKRLHVFLSDSVPSYIVPSEGWHLRIEDFCGRIQKGEKVTWPFVWDQKVVEMEIKLEKWWESVKVIRLFKVYLREERINGLISPAELEKCFPATYAQDLSEELNSFCKGLQERGEAWDRYAGPFFREFFQQFFEFSLVWVFFWVLLAVYTFFFIWSFIKISALIMVYDLILLAFYWMYADPLFKECCVQLVILMKEVNQEYNDGRNLEMIDEPISNDAIEAWFEEIKPEWPLKW